MRAGRSFWKMPRGAHALTIAASVVGLSVLCPKAALAFCRTTTASLPADYDPSEGCFTQGLPLYWKNACVGYSIQQNASKQVSYDDAKDAISTAFSKWTSATCTTETEDGGVSAATARVSIDVRDLGPVACDAVSYDPTGPNSHVILFRDDEWPHNDVNNTLALTTVVFNPDTGELYDADMEINTVQHKVTLQDPVPSDGYDFASIVTHETGHFLGMAHSTDMYATMYARYQQGQTTLRHLTFDDLDGICTIYPPDGIRNTGIGGVPEDACDPTPRHGFSTTCDAASTGGCSVGAVAMHGSKTNASRDAWIGFGAVGFALLRFRRRARSSE